MNDVPAFGSADLGNCDREPIHIPGLIQPFGFLIALSADWLVSRVSANAASALSVDPHSIVGRPVVEVVGAEAAHAIRNRLSLLRGDDASERLFDLPVGKQARRFDIAIHLSGNVIVLEFEPSPAESGGDGAGMIRSMLIRLDQTEGVDRFLREGARQVRAITGFDRVMVYRFDSNGDGQVMAEAVRGGIGSFLNLRYPHTDIPAQARTLYRRNLFRIIPDIEAEPVPVLPTLDEAGRPLDMSLSVLRAVSPIHIEYLRNMGVRASLSISLVIEGRLWGLFACHHYSPRTVPLEKRSLAELYGQMFAMKLETVERRAASDYAARARQVSDRLLVQLAGDASLRDDPAWLAEALEAAIPADGIGVAIDGHVAIAGQAPEEADFLRLCAELNRTTAGRAYATDRIADLLPEAAGWADRAAGMLALPISRSPRDYVVLFRQEMVRTVRWAGDPHRPKEFGPLGDRLTPRKSFEAWSETVSGRSKPFTPLELEIAGGLRATLIEVVLRMSDEAHVERQAAAERQELLIAELNHRVRNILGLIRGLVRQSRGASGSVDEFVGELDGRIHALARAHNQITSDNWGPAPLRALIETEAEAYLGGRSDRVICDGPDVLLDPHAFSTLALVVHELVTNSAKYGGLSDSGRVNVGWHLIEKGDLSIHWQETGGPPVVPPRRQGFGTTIITRSIPYDLGGEAHLDYAPTGLNARLVIPAKHLGERRVVGGKAVTPSAERSFAATGDDTPPIPGGTVLLVEDSLIIAMDAEDILLRLGADRVVTAASVGSAISEIAAEKPSLAVLDINLGAETSMPVAERLASAGVPFIFASGYGEQARLPDTLADVAVIQKPYTSETVSRGLRMLLAGSVA